MVPSPVLDTVVVTGIGVMSPLGCDKQTAFAASLDAEASWAPDAGMVTVRGFESKRHLPRGRSSRMNQITQLAVAAIEQALTDAGWTQPRRRPTAIGLMVGLSRGAAASFQLCMESVRGGAWDKASPIAFPNLVMSSVGGQASVAVGLKGAASTLVGEAEVGIALLGHAASLLAQRTDLDALVVLAADELAPMFLQLHNRAYGHTALPLAEGAVALVLERQGAAVARGAKPLANVGGWAQSFDAVAGKLAPDADGVWLEHAVRAALQQGGAGPEQVSLALTMARGEAHLDRREAAALLRLFGNTPPPIGALSGHAGWAEASGGLLAVAMAIMAMHSGLVPAPASRSGTPRLGAPWLLAPAKGDFRIALVAGSSRHGSNAAVLLHRLDQASA
jgi:3-oxoacyl-[acyl-carrier-protein] synthase II